MADPMKIRAVVRNGVADVRVLMAHEMETGQRKDSSGKLVPAWYISEVSAALNGKQVLKAQGEGRQGWRQDHRELGGQQGRKTH
jgi:sulfur-oxidizing protein SoxZ